MVIQAVSTYTCVFTVAVMLALVTTDVIPTVTGSEAILAAVTALLAILAVVILESTIEAVTTELVAN